MKEKLKNFYVGTVLPILLKVQTFFILYWLTIVLISIILFVVGYSIWFLNNKCDSEVINAHEIRFYLCLFFISLTILTFAILRLYNAIVINTSISNKVVKTNVQLEKAISDNTRESKLVSNQERSIVSSTATKFANATNSLHVAMDNLTAAVQRAFKTK